MCRARLLGQSIQLYQSEIDVMQWQRDREREHEEEDDGKVKEKKSTMDVI